MRLVPLLCLLAACQPTYEFEPVAVGARPEKAPRPRSNSQYLRAVYTDLLARAPQSYQIELTDASGAPQSSFPIDERDVLLTAADSIGDPTPVRALIAAGLVAAVESTLPEKHAVDGAAFIRAQFQRLLGREPGVYELAAFLEAWQEAEVGPRAIVRAIVASREYQSF